MGQEIVYCYWCSSRIMGTDFDKGAAVLIGNHACCPQCLPKVMDSLPENQRETLLALLKGPAAPARQPARITPRAVPAVSAPGAPPKPSSTLIMGLVVGGIVVVGLLVLWLAGGSPEKPTSREERPERPPPVLESTNRTSEAHDRLQKAKESARSMVDIDQQAKLWESAVALAQGTPVREEALREHAAFLARRKEVLAQELTKLLDNVDTMVKDAEYKRALDVLSGARNRRSTPEWISGVDRKLEEVRKAEKDGVPYRQAEADGLVCLEAEKYHLKVDVGEHAWAPVTVPPGYSGPGAMAALPNKGSNWPKDFAGTSPRLDYRILFAKSGVHYVWIRGHAKDGTDDSVHIGLDGREVLGASAMVVPQKYAWGRRTMIAGAAKIDVPSPGLHTVHLWMREDGAIIDRILITSSDKYVPKDAGPPESSR